MLIVQSQAVKVTRPIKRNRGMEMVRAERTVKMLAMIDERLAAYSVEETVERLHAYGGVGPTVDAFLQSMGAGACQPSPVLRLISQSSDSIPET